MIEFSKKGDMTLKRRMFARHRLLTKLGLYRPNDMISMKANARQYLFSEPFKLSASYLSVDLPSPSYLLIPICL